MGEHSIDSHVNFSRLCHRLPLSFQVDNCGQFHQWTCEGKHQIWPDGPFTTRQPQHSLGISAFPCWPLFSTSVVIQLHQWSYTSRHSSQSVIEPYPWDNLFQFNSGPSCRPLVSTLVGLALSNVGVIPASAPAVYGTVNKFLLPLAVPHPAAGGRPAQGHHPHWQTPAGIRHRRCGNHPGNPGRFQARPADVPGSRWMEGRTPWCTCSVHGIRPGMLSHEMTESASACTISSAHVDSTMHAPVDSSRA